MITDFQDSADRISLSIIDANTAAGPANEAFAFIGTSAFGGAAGELRYDVGSTDVLVSGDVDGDGAADFTFTVQNVTALSATNFLL